MSALGPALFGKYRPGDTVPIKDKDERYFKSPINLILYSLTYDILKGSITLEATNRHKQTIKNIGMIDMQIKWWNDKPKKEPDFIKLTYTGRAGSHYNSNDRYSIIGRTVTLTNPLVGMEMRGGYRRTRSRSLSRKNKYKKRRHTKRRRSV